MIRYPKIGKANTDRKQNTIANSFKSSDTFLADGASYDIKFDKIGQNLHMYAIKFSCMRHIIKYC